jgi:hypothetical protein
MLLLPHGDHGHEMTEVITGMYLGWIIEIAGSNFFIMWNYAISNFYP